MPDSASSVSSVGEMILRSRTSMFPSNSPSMDQALGVAASMGLSLAVVRWLLNMVTRRPTVQGEGADDKDQEVIVVESGGLIRAFMSYIRRTIRKLVLDPNELRQYEEFSLVDEVHVVDGSLITHQGSCHCQSVRFEIKAPRSLVAKEGPGKIKYLHTEIKSSSLRVMRGQNLLKTYYVVAQESHDRGAHVFCERCGCHVMFAPSKNSNRIQINVTCIDEGIRKIRVVDTKSRLSIGAALAGQWDDQLTTISEASHDPHFHFQQAQFRNFESLSTDGGSSWNGGSHGDWNLYDEVEKLEPNSQKAYFAPPHTPTTMSSFTTNANDTRSLPPLRIPREPSDTTSAITESDAFSVSHSEFGFGGRSPPPKPLPQLHDQMKYYMKRHVSKTTSGASFKDEKKSSTQ